jgi:DNA-binding transcriptional LysR family regulator
MGTGESMTIDELEAFLCIAEAGAFTQASRRLARSQPAITRRIQHLEQALGCRLFERTGRKVALTEAGAALLPHAEAALASVRDGERAVRELAQHGARKLAVPALLPIAIVGTLADSHIVDALREFEARFAGASVELRTATSLEVSRLVRSGESALGIRYGADADSRLESLPLGVEKLCVVVPASHRIRAGRLSDLGPLQGERWLGFPPPRGRPDAGAATLERQLVAAGAGQPAITTIDSLTAQKRLVQAGLGIALMTRSSVREELRIGSLRIIEVTSLRAELPVVIVRRRDGYQSRLALSFIELLAAYTPDLLSERAPGKRKRARLRRT